jgi:hypothetical protein
MSELARNLSLAFAAGCVGAVVKILCIWSTVQFGIGTALGLAIQVTPAVHTAFVHTMIGGLWGLLLCLPWLDRSILLRGLAVSILMTMWEGMVTLLPSHNVLLGPRFEWRLVLTVLLFNLIWGQVAAAWYRFVR